MGPDELFDVNGLVAEVYLGEVVHVVPLLGLQEVVCHHRVEKRSGGSHAVSSHHDVVVLDVLPYFLRRRIFQCFFKYIHNSLRCGFFRRDGYIIGLSLGDGERHTHQFGRHGLDAGGFGVERKFLTLFECIGQMSHIFFIVNKKIGVWGAVYVAESRIFFVARPVGRK